MILALDIGNTHIVLGCMEGRRIRYLCRMATNRLTTGAEYAVTISRLLEFGHIAPDAFDGAIISSVVPQVTRSLSEAVKMLTGVEPMVVGPGIRSDLTVRLDDPATLASDLLVLALSLSYLDLKRIAVSLLTVVLSGQLIGFVQNARMPQAEG